MNEDVTTTRRRRRALMDGGHATHREATEFSRWIEKKQLTVADLAARIGVAPKTVYYWAAGLRVPDLVSAFRVQEVTEGEVTAMGFLATKVAGRVYRDLVDHSSWGAQ